MMLLKKNAPLNCWRRLTEEEEEEEVSEPLPQADSLLVKDCVL